MPNGPKCCALEICCLKAKLVAQIVKDTGVEAKHAQAFVDWMDKAELTFAPMSFKATITEIVAMARAHPTAAV